MTSLTLSYSRHEKSHLGHILSEPTWCAEDAFTINASLKEINRWISFLNEE